MSYNLRLLASSVWTQGVRSGYRASYWKFLWNLARRYWNSEPKLWMGSMVLLSAHHFLIYARRVADELERDCSALGEEFRKSVPGSESVPAAR